MRCRKSVGNEIGVGCNAELLLFQTMERVLALFRFMHWHIKNPNSKYLEECRCQARYWAELSAFPKSTSPSVPQSHRRISPVPNVISSHSSWFSNSTEANAPQNHSPSPLPHQQAISICEHLSQEHVHPIAQLSTLTPFHSLQVQSSSKTKCKPVPNPKFVRILQHFTCAVPRCRSRRFTYLLKRFTRLLKARRRVRGCVFAKIYDYQSNPQHD